MKCVCVLVSAACVVAAAAPVVTGGFTLDCGPAEVAPVPVTPSAADGEVLTNPGFESGSLAPWQSGNWIVDTIYPHSGAYCASDVGNYWIVQFFDTLPCAEIQSVTFWARQPEAPAAQAYDCLYSDSSYEEFVHFPTADWQQFDVTYRLNLAKELVGFRLWGYSGGGPDPDSTYIDDVSIQSPNVGVGGPERTRLKEPGLRVFPAIGSRFAVVSGDGPEPVLLVDAGGRLVCVLARGHAEWDGCRAASGVYFASCGPEVRRLVLTR